MPRFLMSLIINALALWLMTLILSPHVRVVSYAPNDTFATVLTYLLVAFIFGVVNGVIGTLIRIVAFPLYLLTLGLLALIVNALLLLIVAGVSTWFRFGLIVESFWWGVLGALLLSIASWLLGLILRPLIGRGG
jgi:putative membrane protein